MPLERRDGEPVITDGLVRALLAEQHPDLGALPLGESFRGWDNTMIRLGDRLALRLPRHAPAEGLLDREVAWLPVLARQLGEPAGIPTPARTGVPGCGFPFRWAVVPWVAGTPAVRVQVAERDAYARHLAGLLRAIHRPAPDRAPASAFRGTGVADVADRFAERLAGLADQLGSGRRARLESTWAVAMAARPHGGPRVWLHGDPHPNNTVLAAAGLGGSLGPEAGFRPVLVDFGDLCAGDPASDLGAGLLHFSPAGQRDFRAAYGGPAPVAERQALWERAEGWAVTFALAYAAQSEDEPLRPLGRHLLG